ncbi:integral membrane protein [Mycobacterium tuberculosis CAS/NITR204]|uniref:Integral membrane protein n=1 Tax=Mycobacterium tuberculosis CAS/NITR204 TaxID=1310114 RepID=R4MDJ3_MYCTX|nr:integral membrane protein [Mycobacterium tuberculosis CAS/NITR204]
MTTRDEYLWQVPGIADIPATLRTFTSRILDFQPNSWVTHVSGHPPGALLTFVWLDRIGLRGGGWAGLVCLLVGSSAAAAVLIAVRVLASEQMARRTAPFVAVAPTAIWIAVSADGYFAGVAAWGIALLAVAVHGATRFPALVAAGAGLLLGWGVFLNYGLVLIVLPGMAVLAAADWRPVLRALGPAVLAALVVAVSFAVAGFSWFDGYTLVQQRYWQGVAKDRPFGYWSWANLACVVCAIGLGSVAGLSRVFDRAAISRRSGCHLLLLAVLAAIALAVPERWQSRDRTNLAALHHLADRGARTAAAPLAPTLAGGQRRRGPTAEQHHLHQLVSKCAGAASESSRAGSLREPTPRSAAIAYQRDVVHDVEVAQTLH